jgi:hypothetical protein
MGGCCIIRYGAAVRRIAALLVLAVLTGCGGSSGSSSPAPSTSSSRQSLADADATVVSKLDGYITRWNKAITPWSKAYKSGNGQKFLSVQERYTAQMNDAAIRIRLGSSQIADPVLRGLMRRLGDAYRSQLRAVVAVDNSVVNGDLKAGQKAVAQLQRAADHKITVGQTLADRYPQLGAGFSR